MVKKHVKKSKGTQPDQDGRQASRKVKSKRIMGREDDDTEIKSLEARIVGEAPKRGRGAFASSEKQKDAVAEPEGGPALTMQLFKDLPISKRTLEALKENSFTKLTEIQRGAIPHALAGRDVLGEARTGSGKTLAFLVPLIESLFRQRWTRMDGLGSLIVSPTRELSYQIFQVLTAVGAEHDFSAGCVVGGRTLSEEQQSVASMNILVATPGRLLQHLDESPGFDASNLQMLVLDEADRILDFGFQETVANILSHLSRERQSMLFSATLHTSVHRLSKMALQSPEIISVHKDANSRTPDRLKQVYMTLPLEQKMDVLFSFLRSHSQKKMIVFVSSCKQVRFLFETFKELKPGPAIMELHGKQSLTKRLIVFDKFAEKERAVALFCTDIAARGVDFPAVDWVLQLDCPDTVESYVHRVGRTARYESGGNSLLLLLPSEEAFIPKLKTHRVAVKSISAKSGKVNSIQSKIQGVVAGDHAIKHLAQRSLVSYVRSLKLMKDKDVFNVAALPLESFANSLGLANVPEDASQVVDNADSEKNPLKMKKNMSALQRLKEKIKAKKASAASASASAPAPGGKPAPGDKDDSESEDNRNRDGKKKKLSRFDRRQRRMEQLENAPPKEADEQEDDLLVPVEESVEAAPSAAPSKKRKLKLGKDGIAKGAEGKHTFFASKGATSNSQFAQLSEEFDNGKSSQVVASKESRQAFLQRVSGDLQERDGADAAVSRARIQEKHKKRRRIAKEERLGDGDDESGDDVGVQLGGADSASSRSPSPSPAASRAGSESPKVFPGRPNASAFPARKQQQPSTGGGTVDAADDLGALEKQVLSRLGGLF